MIQYKQREIFRKEFEIRLKLFLFKDSFLYFYLSHVLTVSSSTQKIYPGGNPKLCIRPTFSNLWNAAFKKRQILLASIFFSFYIYQPFGSVKCTDYSTKRNLIRGYWNQPKFSRMQLFRKVKDFSFPHLTVFTPYNHLAPSKATIHLD